MISYTTCLVYVFIVSISDVYSENGKELLCAHTQGSIEHLSEDGTESSDIDSSQGPFIKCENYCFTVWLEDGNNESKVMGQGMLNFFFI